MHQGDFGAPAFDAAGPAAFGSRQLESPDLHLLDAIGHQHAGLARRRCDDHPRAARIGGEGGDVLGGDHHRVVDLDGLVAGLAVAVHIDHAVVGHIGGRVGNRMGPEGGVAAIHGHAGRAAGRPWQIGARLDRDAVRAAVALGIATSPAPAAAVPDAMMDMVVVDGRVQQDPEVGLHLFGDAGVHREGRRSGGRQGGGQGRGDGRGGEDRAREPAHQWLLPSSAGGAWVCSEDAGEPPSP